MLMFLYTGASVMLIGVSFLPPLWLVVTPLFIGMMCLGAGNGSVFQLVPQRFGGEIGLVTGIVGRRRAWRLCSAAYSRPIIPGDRLIHSGLHYFKFHSAASLTLTVVMRLKWRRSWLRSVSSGPQAGSAKL